MPSCAPGGAWCSSGLPGWGRAQALRFHTRKGKGGRGQTRDRPLERRENGGVSEWASLRLCTSAEIKKTQSTSHLTSNLRLLPAVVSIAARRVASGFRDSLQARPGMCLEQYERTRRLEGGREFRSSQPTPHKDIYVVTQENISPCHPPLPPLQKQHPSKEQPTQKRESPDQDGAPIMISSAHEGKRKETGLGSPA